MNDHLHLIVRQLTHLQRMSEYLAHSVQRCQQILPIMINATPELFACHHKLLGFCREAYGVKPE